jgi:tripartite-type tricarboxylate transporter receptor subunit TctC
LIDLAKKRPGALNHGSGGTATLLALELFKSMAGVDIASVPFPGGVPAVNAVLSGSVETLFADVATVSAALHSPNARLLAVTTFNKQKFLPTLPTIDESGVPGYDVRTWMGAFAPANTPPDVARKIENDISEAMRSPSVRGRLEAIGMEMGKGGAAEMRDTLAADIAKWGKLIRERNIAIDQN